MKRPFSRTLFVSFAMGLLLITAHRLPAPISELPEATPKAKSREGEPGSKSKPSTEKKSVSAPRVSFAGTWTGTASGRMQQAVFGPTTTSANLNIQISPDERTVSWTTSAWMFGKTQAAVQKNGRTLTWTCERHYLAGKIAVACRLEMDANGTARYSESSGLVNGMFKGAGYELTGTLIRQ
jgi:hypothetical protein